ncbi:unnamed protein product, partial [Ectocarpus sp. 4 AP-2014]
MHNSPPWKHALTTDSTVVHNSERACVAPKMIKPKNRNRCSPSGIKILRDMARSKSFDVDSNPTPHHPENILQKRNCTTYRGSHTLNGSNQVPFLFCTSAKSYSSLGEG